MPAADTRSVSASSPTASGGSGSGCTPATAGYRVGHDEQHDGGRADQAAQERDGERVQKLEARAGRHDRRRNEQRRGGQHGRDRRRSRLQDGPSHRLTGRVIGGVHLCPADQHERLSQCQGDGHAERCQHAAVQNPAGELSAQHASDGGERHCGEEHRGTAPAAGRRLEEQVRENGDQEGGDQDPLPVRGPGHRVTDDLGAVLEREVHLPEGCRHVRGHVGRATATDGGGDVEAARHRVMCDHRRVGGDLHPGHGTQRDPLTARRLEEQGVQAVDARPGRRAAPQDDVEDGLLLVEAADGEPGDERAGVAAHVARPQADPLRCREVHLDLDGRLADLLLDGGRDDAGDGLDLLPHVLRGASQGGQILAVHPDDEPVARGDAGSRHLVGRIGRHLTAQPRVTGDGRPDRAEGAGVVGAVGDRHPDLAVVHVGQLVGCDRPPDVRPRGADASAVLAVLRRPAW